MSSGSTARTDRIERLRNPSFDWSFIWSEYRSATAACSRYWRDVIAPADARVRKAVAECRPFNRTAAALRALEVERARRRAKAVPDYEALQETYAALLDHACGLRAALLAAPAPDMEALRWKIGILGGASRGLACMATREMIATDACRLFNSQMRA